MSNDDDSAHTINLAGSLTLARSEEIHAVVLDALSAHTGIEIDCSAAEEIDVTFLQILIAAGRMASGWGKTINLRSPLNGLLADAVKRSGFLVTSPTASIAEIFSL